MSARHLTSRSTKDLRAYRKMLADSLRRNPAEPTHGRMLRELHAVDRLLNRRGAEA